MKRAGAATLGVVSALWRYPVKSMQGEQCDRLALEARGIEGDRRYALRDAAGRLGSGKSTRRFRQIDGLLELRAEGSGEKPQIVFPDGRRFGAGDPHLDAALSAAFGAPLALARENAVSHLDASPVHLLTTASLAWLRAFLPDAEIDARRFRPNVLIDAPGAEPLEQSWIGRSVRIGDEVRLRITEPTQRCRMVTLAQAGLPADPRIVASLSRASDLLFGVYAEVLEPGRISCDDVLTALD